MPTPCRKVFPFAVALVLLFTGCAKKKGDPAEAAKKFFEQLGEGKTAEAYGGAAFGFQAQQTEKSFAKTVKELGLTEQKSLRWQPAELGDQEAKLKVDVVTRSGGTIPFIVTLVHESGAWRVYSLRTPKSQASGRTENPFTLVGKGAAFNDEGQIDALVRHAVRKFDEALRDQSFVDFFNDVSDAWRKQLTVAKLQRAFQPFIDAGVRFGGLDEAELKLDGPPSIDSEGVLVVNGHLQTAPYQVYFSMKFIYEYSRWKLFGLDLKIQR